MMKHVNRKSVCEIMLLLLLFTPPIFSQRDPTALKFPDIDFKPPKPSYLKIEKSVDLYYIEDHEVPVINIYFIFKIGSQNDPKGKEGLANLTFRLLEKGGVENIKPEEVEERLDFLGSTINVYSYVNFSYIHLWTLSKNFNDSWKILEGMLLNPSFDKERVDSEKRKIVESIRRRWDKASNIGTVVFKDLVFGKDFPEARRVTTASINSISVQDIRAFYNNYIKTSEIIIAFSGDFNTRKIVPVTRKSFNNRNVKATSKLTHPLPKLKTTATPGIYLIDKHDLSQAVICMGHLGINNLDPDNAEINILNFIYGGGGFNSRLTREIRSNRGLAYITYGTVGKGRYRGAFFNFCMTKSESVGKVIIVMKDIMLDITQIPVTTEELTTALKYEQNSFAHLFDSPQSVLLWEILYKVYGYPDDYLDTYIQRIKRVDEKKVLDMAKRTIHPDELIILVVGKKSEIYQQLKDLNLGDIRELSLPKE